MTSAASMPTPTPSTRRRAADEYVLGTDGDEAFRLGLQHRMWSAAAHTLWERAKIQPGSVVLDLGCGPGHATVDLAQIVGSTGHVTGIDESASFLKQLNEEAMSRRLTNVERVLGDVQDLDNVMPGHDGAVDAAYARWVFCFLSQPEAVVKGVRRLLKPGGRFIVQDYFNYELGMTLAPRREMFSRIVRAIAHSWRANGGDPDIMGTLPRLLQRNGFEIQHLDVNQRIARPGSTLWHWPDSFYRNFVPRLVADGLVSEAEAAAFFDEWRHASKDPGSFVLVPPVFDLIAVKTS